MLLRLSSWLLDCIAWLGSSQPKVMMTVYGPSHYLFFYFYFASIPSPTTSRQTNKKKKGKRILTCMHHHYLTLPTTSLHHHAKLFRKNAIQSPHRNNSIISFTSSQQAQPADGKPTKIMNRPHRDSQSHRLTAADKLSSKDVFQPDRIVSSTNARYLFRLWPRFLGVSCFN